MSDGGASRPNDASTGEDDRIAGELADALANDPAQIVLEYQPLIRLDDYRILGLEALVRWDHPRRGRLGPDRFVPIAEATDLVAQLDYRVLRSATAEFAAAPWTDGLALAVNASRRTLCDPGFADRVTDALADAELDRGDFCVEVTESLAEVTPGSTARAITELRDRGVAVALDDVGAEFTTVDDIVGLAASVVKVAKPIIDDIGTRDGADAELRRVVAVAESKDLPVIVEGVETAEQLAGVIAAGVRYVQGHVFAKAAPLESFASTRIVSAP